MKDRRNKTAGVCVFANIHQLSTFRGSETRMRPSCWLPARRHLCSSSDFTRLPVRPSSHRHHRVIKQVISTAALFATRTDLNCTTAPRLPKDRRIRGNTRGTCLSPAKRLEPRNSVPTPLGRAGAATASSVSATTAAFRSPSPCTIAAMAATMQRQRVMEASLCPSSSRTVTGPSSWSLRKSE